MKINYSKLTPNFRQGIEALKDNGFIIIQEEGICLEAIPSSNIMVEKTNEKLCIYYDTEPHFYMALAQSIGMKNGLQPIMPKVKEFGFMLDCSRNAVAKPNMIKKLICLLALAGYNYLELYTEDTYEIPNEPYFGYQRGRYTANELSEIVAFADVFGIEMVPCVQTLAHLGHLANWPVYAEHMDINDILLVDDDRTYQLIRKCIRFWKTVYHTKRINIGCDEAFRLGRGKYTDINGYKPKHQIFLEHLKKVFAICKEEGVEPEFWADAFYRDSDSAEDIQPLIDGNQVPIYWDYYSLEKSHHVEKIQKLQQYAGKVQYAGGLWKWIGYAPDNEYSERVTDVAFEAAIENGVDNILMTAWGDDGNECSVYAVMASMWYATRKIYPCEANLNEILKSLTGYTRDEWKKCDAINRLMPHLPNQSNASKCLLYNDYLIGLMDYHIPDSAGELFEKLAAEFKCLSQVDSQFSYIFKTYETLCDALQYKATYGKRLYQTYHAKNKDAMEEMLAELEIIREKLKLFYSAQRVLWMEENKTFGLEVFDIRIGGLISRVDTVVVILKKYLSGETDFIYELEGERINYFCNDSTGEEIYTPFHGYWATQYTVNNI